MIFEVHATRTGTGSVVGYVGSAADLDEWLFSSSSSDADFVGSHIELRIGSATGQAATFEALSNDPPPGMRFEWDDAALTCVIDLTEDAVEAIGVGTHVGQLRVVTAANVRLAPSTFRLKIYSALGAPA